MRTLSSKLFKFIYSIINKIRCFEILYNLKEDILVKPIYEESMKYLDEMKSIFLNAFNNKDIH